jgi:carbonic anhydrase/acetyltransferase-like protein (isoleucine patch superfamily)
MGHTVENRAVKMGWVTLGKRVTVGSCSAVLPGAVLEDGCVLGDMSLVMKNDTVPAGSVWAGIPAVPVGTTKSSSDKLSDSCKLSDSAKTASEMQGDS